MQFPLLSRDFPPKKNGLARVPWVSGVFRDVPARKNAGLSRREGQNAISIILTRIHMKKMPCLPERGGGRRGKNESSIASQEFPPKKIERQRPRPSPPPPRAASAR